LNPVLRKRSGRRVLLPRRDAAATTLPTRQAADGRGEELS
jgi:hypothetical protein